MMATCWAGKKDWKITRKEQNSPKDKYNFITYILNKMKLPTDHRTTENKDGEKWFKRKALKDMGPRDISVPTREGGPTVQLCGDSNVACKRINGEFGQGTEYKERTGKIQSILHSWSKRRVATPISNNDSFVKQVYKEHHQEAHHWADIGAQGRRKFDIYGKDAPNMESDTWFLGWKLQRQWQKRMWNSDERGRQRKMGDNQ